MLSVKTVTIIAFSHILFEIYTLWDPMGPT